MARESKAHKLIKEQARNHLKKEGFGEEEIEEEYYFKDPKRDYAVDVVGISDEKKIAIECGEVGQGDELQQKIIFEVLNKRFDEVWQYPYLKKLRGDRVKLHDFDNFLKSLYEGVPYSFPEMIKLCREEEINKSVVRDAIDKGYLIEDEEEEGYYKLNSNH